MLLAYLTMLQINISCYILSQLCKDHSGATTLKIEHLYFLCCSNHKMPHFVRTLSSLSDAIFGQGGSDYFGSGYDKSGSSEEHFPYIRQKYTETGLQKSQICHIKWNFGSNQTNLWLKFDILELTVFFVKKAASSGMSNLSHRFESLL